MGARVRAAVALLTAVGVLGGAAGAYATTVGSKTKTPAKSHATRTMNGTKAGNCPNM